MKQRRNSVTILNADGTAVASTHWEEAAAALEQFHKALQLAGHSDEKVKYHLHRWENTVRLGLPGVYEVLNPGLQGAVRISTTRSQGG